jgi:hypothetical protein
MKQAHDDLYEAHDISYGGPFGEFDRGRSMIEKGFEQVVQRNLQGEIVAFDVHMVEGTDLGYTICDERSASRFVPRSEGM